MSGNGRSKALELLRSLPRVSLANLRPSPGSKKPVSACGLSGGSRACFLSGGRTLPGQRARPALVAAASGAVRRPLGRLRQAQESGLAKIGMGRLRNGWHVVRVGSLSSCPLCVS